MVTPVTRTTSLLLLLHLSLGVELAHATSAFPQNLSPQAVHYFERLSGVLLGGNNGLLSRAQCGFIAPPLLTQNVPSLFNPASPSAMSIRSAQGYVPTYHCSSATQMELITSPLAPESCAFFSISNIPSNSEMGTAWSAPEILTRGAIPAHKDERGNQIAYLCNHSRSPKSFSFLSWNSPKYVFNPRSNTSAYEPADFRDVRPAQAVIERLDYAFTSNTPREGDVRSVYIPTGTDVEVLRVSNGREYRTQYIQTNRGLHYLEESIFPAHLLDTREMIERGLRVLDAGCGECAFVLDLQALGISAIGLDLVLDQRLRSVPYLMEADMTRTPFEDESFDLIYSTYTIFIDLYESGNILLIENAFREFKRLLSPGGRIRIAPIDVRSLAEILDRIGGLRILERGSMAGNRGQWIEIQRI